MNLRFALLIAAAACHPMDEHCTTWTAVADDCLEQTGEAPAYVAGVDCEKNDATAAMHQCLDDLWSTADCSTPEAVSAVETDALACVP